VLSQRKEDRQLGEDEDRHRDSELVRHERIEGAVKAEQEAAKQRGSEGRCMQG
jgi:hypothetical protein